MRQLLFFCALVFPFTVIAQRWQLTGFGGISNYQGDFQEKRLTTNQSHAAFGLGLQYDILPHLSAHATVKYGKLSGDDKQNSDSFLISRNLNFSTHILDFSLLGEYAILDLDYYRFTPYLFTGISFFAFDPYTYDSAGHKFFLRPYSTEGQGLSAYPDRKPYKRMQLAIPFGGGIRFKVSDQLTLGYEIGIRKTFTDYLDDLSNTYVDHDILLAQKGPKAVELAYRGGELKNGNPVYPPDGTVRGGPKVKDWYYFQGLTVSYRLKTSSSGFGRNSRLGRNHQTDCPKKVQ